MHFLSFQFKRAYYATLSVGRSLARHFGLTPARFDILYAVHNTQFRQLLQSRLRTLLGVSRATICRMLQRLEELGLVRRERSSADTRTHVVSLTEEGERRLDAALVGIHGAGYLHNAYHAFYYGSGYGLGRDPFIEIDILHWRVRHLARHLGDRSLLAYPTDHPDD